MWGQWEEAESIHDSSPRDPKQGWFAFIHFIDFLILLIGIAPMWRTYRRIRDMFRTDKCYSLSWFPGFSREVGSGLKALACGVVIFSTIENPTFRTSSLVNLCLPPSYMVEVLEVGCRAHWRYLRTPMLPRNIFAAIYGTW